MILTWSTRFTHDGDSFWVQNVERDYVRKDLAHTIKLSCSTLNEHLKRNDSCLKGIHALHTFSLENRKQNSIICSTLLTKNINLSFLHHVFASTNSKRKRNGYPKLKRTTARKTTILIFMMRPWLTEHILKLSSRKGYFPVQIFQNKRKKILMMGRSSRFFILTRIMTNRFLFWSLVYYISAKIHQTKKLKTVIFVWENRFNIKCFSLPNSKR